MPTGVVRNSVGLIVGGLAVILIAATLASDGTRATASSMTMVAATNIVAGNFVEFDATGLPVYRLPSISVSVDRNTALARIALGADQNKAEVSR